MVPLNYKCNKDLWKLPLFLLSGVTVELIQSTGGVQGKGILSFKAKGRAFLFPIDLSGLILPW